MKLPHLERVIKGFANGRRIQILELLDKKPDMSLLDIADELKVDFRTAGEHTRKLAIAGLILKRHNGQVVEHAISPRGKVVLKFCRKLE